MIEEHAKLSPSSARRWMACPGSVVLEANEPDIENEYATEGTEAHRLAYDMISGIAIVTGSRGQSKETIDHLQKYVSYVREKGLGHTVMLEQRLSIEHITGENNAKGTADAVIVSENGETITVIDLKYGMGVRVDAEENPQLMIYALGALRQFDTLGDFKKVILVIHQPRLNHISEWHTTPEVLHNFSLLVREAASEIKSAQQANNILPFLAPGEKQCKFCKAKANCPALATEIAKTFGVDFEDLNQNELPDPGVGASLSQKMAKVPLLEMLAKAVRAKVEAELLSGVPVESYKLVEGKRGNRQWVDDDEAEKMLKSMRLNTEQMYDLSVKSPTKIEKVVAENHPMKWERLQTIITQKQGKPSVAHVSDPRPALEVNPSEDFDNLEIPKSLKRKKGEAA